MTTIAVRNKIISADSGISINGVFSTVNKLFPIGGDILAGAGDYSGILKFVEWWENGHKEADIPEFRKYYDGSVGANFEIFVLNDDGLTLWTENFQYVPIHASYFAIGSGSQFALGAMACGKTAREAVEIAAQFDMQTGGTIMELSL